MISDIRKHGQAPLKTEIVDQIALFARNPVWIGRKLSYTTARLYKLNAKRSYALTQNKVISKMNIPKLHRIFDHFQGVKIGA